MKLTEEQKQNICERIKQSLQSVSMVHFTSCDNDPLSLVDFLSIGPTIKEGRDEVENIIEHIFIDMDNWDV